MLLMLSVSLLDKPLVSSTMWLHPTGNSKNPAAALRWFCRDTEDFLSQILSFVFFKWSWHGTEGSQRWGDRGWLNGQGEASGNKASCCTFVNLFEFWAHMKLSVFVLTHWNVINSGRTVVCRAGSIYRVHCWTIEAREISQLSCGLELPTPLFCETCSPLSTLDPPLCILLQDINSGTGTNCEP